VPPLLGPAEKCYLFNISYKLLETITELKVTEKMGKTNKGVFALIKDKEHFNKSVIVTYFQTCHRLWLCLKILLRTYYFLDGEGGERKVRCVILKKKVFKIVSRV